MNDEGIVKYGLSKKKDKRIITYNRRQIIDLFSSETSFVIFSSYICERCEIIRNNPFFYVSLISLRLILFKMNFRRITSFRFYL